MDALLLENNVSHKYLEMDYAFHCSRVNEISEEFLQRVKDIKSQSLQIPVFSTTKGTKLTKDDGLFLTPDFWIQNTANPVLFEHSTKLLLQEKGNFRHLFI